VKCSHAKDEEYAPVKNLLKTHQIIIIRHVIAKLKFPKVG
jgi:hypothetical protein